MICPLRVVLLIEGNERPIEAANLGAFDTESCSLPEVLIVKIKSLVACIAFVLSGAAIAQQSTGVQGSAAGNGGANVAADKDSASVNGNAAGSAAATTDHASANLAQGAELNATLTKPVDASKAKPGDEVTAIVNEDIKSDGQVAIRKGSKLVGHVTSAQPLKNGKGAAEGTANSQLGVVFDRAVLKDGREVPLNATVQALATAESSASAGMSDMDAGMAGAGSAAGSMRSGGGGLVGGVAGGATGAVGGVGGVAGGAGGIARGTVGGSTGLLSKSTGAVGGLNTQGQLTSGSKGVFGMKGVDLSSATNASGSGSVVTSSTRNVKLDRGTRMLLVQGNAAGSAAGSANATSAKGEPVDHR
jgi:hypothetical protein